MKTKKKSKPRDRGRSFHADLNKLIERYPEYVISAWCPEDFQSVVKDELTPDELLSVAEELRGNFDAGIGINWEVVSEAVFAVKEYNQDE